MLKTWTGIKQLLQRRPLILRQSLKINRVNVGYRYELVGIDHLRRVDENSSRIRVCLKELQKRNLCSSIRTKLSRKCIRFTDLVDDALARGRTGRHNDMPTPREAVDRGYLVDV